MNEPKNMSIESSGIPGKFINLIFCLKFLADEDNFNILSVTESKSPSDKKAADEDWAAALLFKFRASDNKNWEVLRNSSDESRSCPVFTIKVKFFIGDSGPAAMP